jgi:hypothetical protein
MLWTWQPGVSEGKKMTEQSDIEKELAEILSKATPAGFRDEGRFRFGIGMLLLSPFCVSVAFFPWPSAVLTDKLMWLGFALVLLGVGAWQIDLSNRYGPKVHDDPPPEKVDSTSTSPMRRVK